MNIDTDTERDTDFEGDTVTVREIYMNMGTDVTYMNMVMGADLDMDAYTGHRHRH